MGERGRRRRGLPPSLPSPTSTPHPTPLPTYLRINHRQVSVGVPHDGVQILYPGGEEGPESAPETCPARLPVAGVVRPSNTVHVSRVWLVEGGQSQLRAGGEGG